MNHTLPLKFFLNYVNPDWRNLVKQTWREANAFTVTPNRITKLINNSAAFSQKATSINILVNAYVSANSAYERQMARAIKAEFGDGTGGQEASDAQKWFMGRTPEDPDAEDVDRDSLLDSEGMRDDFLSKDAKLPPLEIVALGDKEKIVIMDEVRPPQFDLRQFLKGSPQVFVAVKDMFPIEMKIFAIEPAPNDMQWLLVVNVKRKGFTIEVRYTATVMPVEEVSEILNSEPVKGGMSLDLPNVARRAAWLAFSTFGVPMPIIAKLVAEATR